MGRLDLRSLLAVASFSILMACGGDAPGDKGGPEEDASTDVDDAANGSLVDGAASDADVDAPDGAGDAGDAGDADAAGDVDDAGDAGDAACTDTANDPLNCGACGAPCVVANATPSCKSGECAVGTCNAGFGDCDHDPSNGCEVDVLKDSNHCGACGTTCPTPSNATAACINGTCGVGTCAFGYQDCDNSPANGCEINASTDITNCGGCGTACPTPPNASPSCNNGLCGIASCQSGHKDCDGNLGNGCETNATNDSNNCGGCGTKCPTPANASAACNNGSCGIGTCSAGHKDCNADPADGCEVNTDNDPNNCGGCGIRCSLPNASAACINGSCGVGSCNGAYKDCNSTSGDGCEIDTANDSNNCNGCGNVCSVPNATPSCSSGSCRVASCNPGFSNCDGNPLNGCEIATATDRNNCGACGRVCGFPNAAAGCAGGNCTLETCNAGYANCNGFAGDGCETDPKRDVNHCGGCGQKCTTPNGTPACLDGACAVASCKSGYLNCNGVATDGCEANAMVDNNNCGGCGRACGSVANGASGCSSGSCAVTSCNGGFRDCNNTVTDGCETDTRSDAAHCGGCGFRCQSVANATPSCSSSTCVPVCNGGFANCDNNYANGCEVNTTNDANNCGGCGIKCSVPHATAKCTGSGCAVDVCDTWFMDCNGNAADGCEAYIPTDNNNCGGCGIKCTGGKVCNGFVCR
jgi:hypothetical protein